MRESAASQPTSTPQVPGSVSSDSHSSCRRAPASVAIGIHGQQLCTCHVNIYMQGGGHTYAAACRGSMRPTLQAQIHHNQTPSTHVAVYIPFFSVLNICRGSMRPGEGPKWTRPSPEAYKAKYRPLAAQYGISPSTTEVRNDNLCRAGCHVATAGLLLGWCQHGTCVYNCVSRTTVSHVLAPGLAGS